MPHFEQRSSLPFSAETVFAYHERPGALHRLLPPWANLDVLREPESLQDGSRAEILMMLGPLRTHWIAEHFDYVAGEQFCDRQIKGPMASWTHRHRVLPENERSSVLLDQIEYELPAHLRPGAFVARRELARTFAFRHARTRFDLQRQAKYADRPQLRIALTGASGAIGSTLAPFLTTAGHTVVKLVRSQSVRRDEAAWNSLTGEVDEHALGRCDVVIHLAGKNIATRWTDAAKREIRQSRIDATRLLCERLARLENKPRLLIAASAVGYYGNRGDERLTESSSSGEGWMEQLCIEWEAATQPARDAGIRVVNLRTGIVLSARHGALAKMLLPTQLGIAGRVGSGDQWIPWISMEDEIGIIHESIYREDWQGPLNAVTDSVRQVDFIRTLGKVLARPTLLPMPATAVGAIFGEMGKSLLLGSTRVEPAKLKEAGFEWMLPDLEGALRFEVGRMIPSQ